MFSSLTGNTMTENNYCLQAMIEGLNGLWWHLRLSAKILALLRLSANFLQLRLTKKLKINFFCFKKLNIN